MKFGIFFELQMVKPWSETDEYELYQNSLEQAELADKLGIQYCWAQEHHFLEEYSHSTAPEVFLSAISQRTQNIRLGHGVSLMPPKINHPARVAERISALDLVSNGRVEWGTGESSSRIELEGFNVDKIEKRAMWAEALKETALMMSTTPYAGHDGKYFSMPARNVIPKPRQKPHPPIWMACTNRDSMKMAARLGIGALTFAFMDAKEGKWWVDEYYRIFEQEAKPIGRAVNPNIAMLGGLHVHKDGDVAKKRGLQGQQFFKYGLAHYYRFGSHVPGNTNLWEQFLASDVDPMAGLVGVGGVDEVRESFEELESSGVDQVILLQQAANYKHEHIMESLELFGTEILPDFIARDKEQTAQKAIRLEPAISRANALIEPAPVKPIPTVDAYPLMYEKAGVTQENTGPKRSVEASAVWKSQVSGINRK